VRLLRAGEKSKSTRGADRYFRRGAEHARRLGQAYVGSEHVLLGLASDPAGEAAIVLGRLGVTSQQIEAEIRRDPGTPPPTAIDPQALATLGIDMNSVRARVDQQFGEGALERTRRGCWPVEPSLKRALAHAFDAAGRQPPGDEHVLTGLVAAKDSRAARVLRQLGVDEDALHRALREL
jgi:ATP-dependent Clp protease ATP-binding subunit ClpA